MKQAKDQHKESREKLKRSKLDIFKLVVLDWSVNEGINIWSRGECHKLGIVTKFNKQLCLDLDKAWHKNPTWGEDHVVWIWEQMHL